MAEYTIIRDVTAEIVRLLQEGLTPGIIGSADLIGATNELNKREYAITVCLYAVSRLENALFGAEGEGASVVSLDYVITAESGGDARNKALAEQALLGGVMMLFAGDVMLRGPWEGGIRFTHRCLELDDKLKLNHRGLALFYQASPVVINSAPGRAGSAPRVIEVG